jgi:hypothetical protein
MQTPSFKFKSGKSKDSRLKFSCPDRSWRKTFWDSPHAERLSFLAESHAIANRYRLKPQGVKLN